MPLRRRGKGCSPGRTSLWAGSLYPGERHPQRALPRWWHTLCVQLRSQLLHAPVPGASPQLGSFLTCSEKQRPSWGPTGDPPGHPPNAQRQGPMYSGGNVSLSLHRRQSSAALIREIFQENRQTAQVASYSHSLFQPRDSGSVEPAQVLGVIKSALWFFLPLPHATSVDRGELPSSDAKLS